MVFSLPVIISAVESLQFINLIYVVEPTSISHFTKLNGNVNVALSPILSARSSNDSCGIMKSTLAMRPLKFANEEVKRGDWPWLVAIYQRDKFGTSFACGGNLISKKVVLTAAHCMKSASKSYQPHEILLYFGHHNRLDWNEIDSMRSGVAEIHIHPDYRKHTRTTTNKDADLAILIAIEMIKFNQFIQPVCLWSTDKNDDEAFAVDTIGTVVGWGRNSLNRLASTYPRKVELSIVEFDACLLASKRIASALSNRTFCAGTRDGNGPCHGDSGKHTIICSSSFTEFIMLFI